eukprot:Skav227975  [mRNA]  locus=scaffold4041:44398:45264:+ [translate_table: standard]
MDSPSAAPPGLKPSGCSAARCVILDCGDTASWSVPIYDGFMITHAVQRLDMGGRDITTYVRKCLQDRNQCDLWPGL